MQADVIFAALDAIHREPVDEVRIGRPADTQQQRDPAHQQVAAPAERRDRAVDPRARRPIEPVGRQLDHRDEPLAEPLQRRQQRLQRSRRLGRRVDQRPVRLGQVDLQAIAGIGVLPVALGPRIDRVAHRREQLSMPPCGARSTMRFSHSSAGRARAASQAASIASGAFRVIAGDIR